MHVEYSVTYIDRHLLSSAYISSACVLPSGESTTNSTSAITHNPKILFCWSWPFLKNRWSAILSGIKDK